MNKKDVVVVVERVEMWTIKPPTLLDAKCGKITGSCTKLSTDQMGVEVAERLKTAKLGLFSTFPQ